MPRLTKRDRDGYAYCASREQISCDSYSDCFACPVFDKMLQKLAEYEEDEQRVKTAKEEKK